MAEEITTLVVDLPTSTPKSWDDLEKLLHHVCKFSFHILSRHLENEKGGRGREDKIIKGKSG